MDPRYHVRGSNADEELYHPTLRERNSSPGVDTRWNQVHDPHISRPYYPSEPPAIHTFDDQFDEFVYKSKHIAHCEPTSSAMATAQVCWEAGSEAVAGILGNFKDNVFASKKIR